MAFLTRAELLTSYADNSTGAIVAEDHRNFVESVMVYGAMNSTGYEAIEISTVPHKLEFETATYHYGMLPAANGNIAPPVGGLPAGGTYNEWVNFEEGDYVLTLFIDTDLAGNVYTFQLYNDETPVGNGFVWDGKNDAARLTAALTLPVQITGNAASISARVTANKASVTDFHSISWIMNRLGTTP